MMNFNSKQILRAVIALALMRLFGFEVLEADTTSSLIDLDSGLRPADFIFADQLPKSDDTLLTVAIIKTTSTKQTLAAALTVNAKSLAENAVFSTLVGSTAITIKVILTSPPSTSPGGRVNPGRIEYDLTIKSDDPKMGQFNTKDNRMFLGNPAKKSVNIQWGESMGGDYAVTPEIWKCVVFTH
jgi:hypothetical protein